MIGLAIAVALMLCASLALSSYLHLLYVDSQRIRPRESPQALEFFEDHLKPALKLDGETGMQRFAAVKQCVILLLALDMAFIAGARQGLNAQRVLETLVLTLLCLVLFAYVVPHVMVSRTTGKWALRFLLPARLLAIVVLPLLTVVGFAYSIADLGLAGKQPGGQPTPEDNIEALIEAGQEEGLLEEEDRKLIQSVVEFGDKTVREVMTPRPQIVAVEAGASLEELRHILIEEQYSRIPIYEGTIDRIIGFVHVRDVLEAPYEQRGSLKARELAREAMLVPETKRVNDLLREMQERSQHMAIVIDEYGNTAGLATMEDLVEEIVGEIRDESEPEPDVIEEPDHSFLVSGNLDLDRLKDLTGFRPDHDVESTTLSGLVTEEMGRVPSAGEALELDGIRIEVLASNGLKVERLRVRRLERPAEVQDHA